VITHLAISNYRSLGDGESLTLGPFTALVGRNGSGKSNVVDALSFLRDAMHHGLSGAIAHRHGIAAIRRFSSGRPFNVMLRVQVGLPERATASYGFELAGDSQAEYRVKWEEATVTRAGLVDRFRIDSGSWSGPEGLRPQVTDTGLVLPSVGGDERFLALYSALKSMVIYSVFPDTLRQPQRYSSEKPMLRHGENWVSILQDQPEASWKPELVAALRKLSGDIEDVRVSKAAGFLVAEFLHDSGARKKWFGPEQESDGTLRVAGIISALLQQPALSVVGVEEPELTIHPGALPLLVDFLREASRRSQVVITTHSPELVDCLDAEELRVVERKDGVSTVKQLRESQKQSVKRGLLSLGELMVTEGLEQEPELPGIEAS